MRTFWLWWATNALDQEANGIGSGRCLSVPAQVLGLFGVLDLGCDLLRRHCGRVSFVNNRAVILILIATACCESTEIDLSAALFKLLLSN